MKKVRDFQRKSINKNTWNATTERLRIGKRVYQGQRKK